MPRIYTKTGDDGSTGLLYGGRISKGDLATDAYGTTDEAVAVLGLARSLCEDPDLREDILVLQRELFVVGADLAANPAKRRSSTKASRSSPRAVRRLEQRIDALVTQHRSPGVHRAGREPGERRVGSGPKRGPSRRASYVVEMEERSAP
jgi:cob(I)alamin adenosyltransferase